MHTSTATRSVVARILRLPDVLEATGMSRSSLYKAIREKSFAPPLKRGRASGWTVGDVDAFVNALEATRDEKRAAR